MSDAFDPASVDVVALSPDRSTVDLVIVQSGEWTGSDTQLESLQAKIQSYVGYALDGQLVEQYPEVEGLPWRIVIDCQTGPPDALASAVFAHVAQVLPTYGGSLDVR